ncbi:Sterol 3-beta-glucosyltransferase [Lecanora helva]
MAPEEDLQKRVGRKLTKRRKPFRASSVQYPERLKEGDDVQEDVTATKGKPAQYMNQSVFSMIAAAGSKTDFHARFEGEGSDSEDERESSSLTPTIEEQAENTPSEEQSEKEHESTMSKAGLGIQHAKTSQRSSGRSLPKLKLKTAREKHYMSQSVLLPPKETSSGLDLAKSFTPRDAPVMSKMLEAQAELDKPNQSPADPQASLGDPKDAERGMGTVSLATRLMEIFRFQSPEEVISEYPCWLLQSVLLQGYLYITQHHICFFGYLPKKSNVIAKSGYLSKRGRQNPRFSRYWFTLKGDVLSYYSDPSDLYFPSGNIDLRYGISASQYKDKGADTKDFSVVTRQRVYHFKADSVVSAKEWVKTLQKVIFRSHNDGDSVKISLPIENVIDVEESPVMEKLADTIKIRVIDSDETYAVDEYFFSFFSFGTDALSVLQAIIDNTATQKIPQDLLSQSPICDESRSRDNSQISKMRKSLDHQAGSPSDTGTPVLRENVRATLVPFSPAGSGQASPRMSGEWGRRSIDLSRKSIDLPSRDASRTSFDRGRRSASTSRNRLRKNGELAQSPVPQGSTDSFVHSVEQGTESSAPNISSNDTQTSGSQILSRSDVFQSPTIQDSQKPAPLPKNVKKRKSSEYGRVNATAAEIRVVPPTRAQTEKSSPDTYLDPGRDHRLPQSASSPTLQQLVKAGAYPLQRAAGFAGFLRSRSKRMSNLLATESMGYVEKVSGMWAGGRKHYGDKEGVIRDNQLEDLDDEEDPAEHGDRFRAHFALPESEKLQASYFGYLHRVLPLYGKIYISNRKFCFRSLLPGTKTKLVLPLKDVENVDKEKGFRFGYSGLVVVIRGHEELFFEFNQRVVRDDCAVTLLEILGSIKYLEESGILTQEDREEAETAKAEHQMLQEARQDGHNEHDLRLPQQVGSGSVTPLQEAPPVLFDDPRASILNFKPTESVRITCLTIGSRGDVQPYIALCKGLLAEGHKPKIATHAEFEPWVRNHGIDFAPVDGDPAELMRICVENGMFTYSFLKEASVKFRGWIDELLTSAWKACQNTDILIESPSAMAGIHIAEALGVPYFRAFTMPWTRTRAYPHAFAVPDHKMGGSYNYITYVMFDNVFWKAIAGQVNRWRKRDLGLRSTSLDKMQPNKVPFLYNFSPSVVVPPLDYSDWIRVTGYWFLDEASDWTPPQELTDFIAKARKDDKKIVYIGFGSIVVSDPAALTKTVVDSVLKADIRCILSKGWSDRLGNQDAAVPEVPLPPEILQIKSAPHDWLFKQIDAATHHGGAGTTGASLRAGIPTIVKPFFGDQFFFGSRIEDLGVGICMKKLNVSVFSRALWEATHSQRMIIKAKVLGEQIRKENGVATAIQAIYRDLEYAKTLIKHRTHITEDDAGGNGTLDEESWTFIGDETDPELMRRIAEWEPQKAWRFGEELGKVGGGRESIDLGA